MPHSLCFQLRDPPSTPTLFLFKCNTIFNPGMFSVPGCGKQDDSGWGNPIQCNNCRLVEKIKLKISWKKSLQKMLFRKKGVAQRAIAKSRLLAAGNWLAGEWIERCPMPKCQNANSKQFDKKTELYCIRKSFLWREPFWYLTDQYVYL